MISISSLPSNALRSCSSRAVHVELCVRHELRACSTCSRHIHIRGYDSSKGAATFWAPVSCDVFIRQALTAPKDTHVKPIIKFSNMRVYGKGCESLKGKECKFLLVLDEEALGPVQLFFKIWRQVHQPQVLSWSATARKFKVKAATMSLFDPLMPWDYKSLSSVHGLVHHMCHSTYLHGCKFCPPETLLLYLVCIQDEPGPRHKWTSESCQFALSLPLVLLEVVCTDWCKPSLIVWQETQKWSNKP